jgi:CheY-like chemotaxis protein
MTVEQIRLTPPFGSPLGIPGVKIGPRVLAGVSVLVVDDEADARDVIAEILGDAGARVRTASSVVEALAAVDVSRPDAIVSDIGMPFRDGYDFIHELRTSARYRAQGVPVIAITAFDRGGDRKRALTSGFTSYVSKTDSTDLTSVVANALGRNMGIQ